MARKKLFLGIVILGIFFLSFSTASAQIIETVFSENWESGPGNWDVSNGVWQVGAPTAGPGGAHGGSQCAGTVLDENYPPSTDSRLISPPIYLPEVTGDEEIHLRFWHWFSYERYEVGYVQVSEDSSWSNPVTLDDSVCSSSGGWSRKDVDLTAYAGKKVWIAFYHTASSSYESTGWYIDDITIIKLEPEFTGDFEGGWGDWSAENGVWQIGTPTSGPGSAHGGEQCAGTVLDGNYPPSTDSRLISAPIYLPEVTGDEEILLRFWHWFSYGSYDVGYVQISVYDEVAGWSDWAPCAGPFQGTSGGWTPKIVYLTSYPGKKVRIAFYHTAASPYENTGWYIDDIRLPGVFLIPCEGDFDNDGDVDGSDLAVFAADFGRTNCSLQDFCYGDFDGDCDVDGSDLAIFAADFGRTDCFNVTP
jgi:bacillopeptidase F (M6 metalloprotease family)